MTQYPVLWGGPPNPNPQPVYPPPGYAVSGGRSSSMTTLYAPTGADVRYPAGSQPIQYSPGYTHPTPGSPYPTSKNFGTNTFGPPGFPNAGVPPVPARPISPQPPQVSIVEPPPQYNPPPGNSGGLVPPLPMRQRSPSFEALPTYPSATLAPPNAGRPRSPSAPPEPQDFAPFPTSPQTPADNAIPPPPLASRGFSFSPYYAGAPVVPQFPPSLSTHSPPPPNPTPSYQPPPGFTVPPPATPPPPYTPQANPTPPPAYQPGPTAPAVYRPSSPSHAPAYQPAPYQHQPPPADPPRPASPVAPPHPPSPLPQFNYLNIEERDRLQRQEQERMQKEIQERLRQQLEEYEQQKKAEAERKHQEELERIEREKAEAAAAAEEQRRKAEEELRRQQQAAIEEARRQAAAEAAAQAAAEAAAAAAIAAEAAKQRERERQAEAERIRRKEEEYVRSIEEEKRRHAAQLAALQRDLEARRAEEAARLRRELESEYAAREAQRLKEQSYRLRSELAAQLADETAAQLKAELAAKVKAEEEARIRAEVAAKVKAEEEERARMAAAMETTRDRWEIAPADIQLGKELGRGAFAVVYAGKLYGKEVAVKKLLVTDVDTATMGAFRREVAIMTNLRHPNLLLFMGACTQPGNILLVLERMERGSLHAILHGPAPPPLPFARRVKLLRDTALGVNWLHKLTPAFLHMDLKTANLLVDRNWNVKVADFGLSQMRQFGKDDQGDTAAVATGPVGSPFYMAPEVLAEKPYDTKADVYSFGICCWEILTNQEPYKGMFQDFDELKDAVLYEQARPALPDSFPSPRLKDMIVRCWAHDPAARPSFQEILDQNILDLAVIDHAVPDKHAADFWAARFIDRVFDSKVEWPEFCEGFVHHFNIPKPALPHDDERLHCLRALLTGSVDPAAAVHAITLERFGWLVQAFPFPATTNTVALGLRWLDDIVAAVRHDYFFGDVAPKDAEQLLNGRKPGCYLVHVWSEQPGCLCLAALDKKNKVAHYLIKRTPRVGGAANYGFALEGAVHDDLDSLLRAQAKKLGLKAVCPGSKFYQLFLPRSA